MEITVLAHAKFLQMGLWSPPDRLMAIKIIEEAKIEVFLPLQYFLVTLRYWERPVDMVEVSAYERELRVIAQAGYAAALKAVALLVQERGGPHSEVEGLMTSSASKGDPSALHWMGARALERGGQVEQALRFLSASAELGFADAIDKLFGLYSRGESGVARNYVKASHYGMLLRELYE